MENFQTFDIPSQHGPCAYCGEEKKLLPFGKDGAFVCFQCCRKEENLGTTIIMFEKMFPGFKVDQGDSLIILMDDDKPASKPCEYCGTLVDELRPYGKDGANICFDCGMKPENIETTEKMFDKIRREQMKRINLN